MSFTKESLEYSSKQVALAIVPKCSAFLSILGSGYILQHILRRPNKRKTVFSRLMVGLSTSDVVASICFFLSTWPVPEGTPGAYGAVGTTQTCTAQGFFGQAAYLCTPLYNGMLAFYYLLVIRHQWKEQQLKRIEPFLHVIPVTCALGIAVAGLILDLYNFANFICWIAPLPWGCRDTARYGSDSANCLRGDNAWIYQWAFLYGPVWFLIIFMTICMVLVYRTVLEQEKKASRWIFRGLRSSFGSSTNTTEQTTTCVSTTVSSPPTNNNAVRLKHSKKVANQAMMYVLAFLMTWFFGTLTRILDVAKNRTYFPIVILHVFFLPCQGFFNALVYLRPRWIRHFQKHPENRPTKVLLRNWKRSRSSTNASFEQNDGFVDDEDYCALPTSANASCPKDDGSESSVVEN